MNGLQFLYNSLPYQLYFGDPNGLAVPAQFTLSQAGITTVVPNGAPTGKIFIQNILKFSSCHIEEINSCGSVCSERNIYSG
jgi:hypothetical protein